MNRFTRTSTSAILMRRVSRHAALATTWQPAASPLDDPVRAAQSTERVFPQPATPDSASLDSQPAGDLAGEDIPTLASPFSQSYPPADQPAPPAQPRPVTAYQQSATPASLPAAPPSAAAPIPSASTRPAEAPRPLPQSAAPVPPPGARPPAPLAPQVVQPKAVPASPPAPQPPGETSLESDWPRLQAIMAAHRRRDEAQPAESSRPAPPQPDPAQPTGAPAQPRPTTRPPDLPRMTESAAQGAFVPLAARRSETAARGDAPPPAALQRAPIAKPDASETPQATDDLPQFASLSDHAQPPQQAEPPQELTAPALTSAWPETTTATGEAAPPSPTGSPAADAPVTGAVSDAPAALQTSPLETAWPVQRKETRGAGPPVSDGLPRPIPAQAGPESASTALASSPPQTSEFSEPPPAAIAQPDEVLAPRGPRPAALQTRRAPQGQTPEEIAPRPAGDAPPAQPPLAPEMVATEIGPLPADLWQLVGEKPPIQPGESQPPLPPQVEPPSRDAPPAALQRMPANDWPTDAPPSRAASSSEEGAHSDAVLQTSTSVRQEQESAPATPAQPSAAPAETGGQSPEHGLERLVQQVYAEIRRRLALDWERRRP